MRWIKNDTEYEAVDISKIRQIEVVQTKDEGESSFVQAFEGWEVRGYFSSDREDYFLFFSVLNECDAVGYLDALIKALEGQPSELKERFYESWK